MTSNGESRVVDIFDRILGSLIGLPEVTQTKPTTIRTMTPLIGTSEIYIIQTFRQKDEGDVIFLEAVRSGETVRLALPPQVADAIARQRDTLTGKSRSRAARENMRIRMERGEKPGFHRKKPKS